MGCVFSKYDVSTPETKIEQENVLQDAKKYLFVTASILCVASIIIILGWITERPVLAQIFTNFEPMHSNVALSFLLCGAGLFSLALNKKCLTELLGLLIFLLGFITFADHIWQLNTGINSFFIQSDMKSRVTSNAALGLIFIGLALLLTHRKPYIMAGFALSCIYLATMAPVGCHFLDDKLFGFGIFTHMTYPIVAGFYIASFALLFFVYFEWKHKRVSTMEIIPFPVAMTIALMTLFSWYTYLEVAKKFNEVRISDLIHETEEVIEGRFDLFVESLRAGRGVYYASDYVSRNEWEKFIDSMHISQRLKGVRGVGYIDRVDASTLGDYVENVRYNEYPNFKVYPQTLNPEKYIVKYFTPRKYATGVIGFDFNSEEVRSNLANRAMDYGLLVLSNKIKLIHDPQDQYGFILIEPVYRTLEIPLYDTLDIFSTVEERRERHSGWIFASIRASDIFEDISHDNNYQLDLTIHSKRTKDSPEIPVHISTSLSQLAELDIFTTTTIQMADQEWILRWYPNDNYTPPMRKGLGIIVAITGIGLALFLYFTLAYILRSREIIKEQVKQRTRELAESEGRCSAILNNTVDAIVTSDSHGKIMSFNTAAELMFGYKANEIIGQNVRVLAPEPHRSRHDGYLERYLSTREPHIIGRSHELEAVHKSGTTFPIELSLAEIKLENDILFNAVIRDISIAKAVQQEILEVNDELSRSNQELERFAYIASHDLQEPLRKIGGFTERLEKHLGKKLDKKSTQYVEFITGGVERMRTLISGLLEYSRITTSELKVVELDSTQIVGIAKDNMSEAIKENNANIIVNKLPRVCYDEVMFTQLFQNLIGNAIKYRGEADPEIEISAKRDGNFWEFSIQDNGMGMEEKYLERIFEMFQRLHRKEEISGTGIGLSLCQKIVERYHGKIWVESELDKGSTFLFTIPADMPEAT